MWARQAVAKEWQEASCQPLLEMAKHSWQGRAEPAAPSRQEGKQLKPQGPRQTETAGEVTPSSSGDLGLVTHLPASTSLLDPFAVHGCRGAGGGKGFSS